MSKISFLQTGDWHIDVSPSKAPRHEDHEYFLKWMLKLMREQHTQVLLHTGNIFNRSIPSHQGLLLLNKFIAEASKLPHLKSMIFISGNHDPKQLMESLNPLLQATERAQIHFISQPSDILVHDEDRFLIPITDPESGTHLASVVALPYIPHPILLSQYKSNKKSAIKRFSDVQKSLKRNYTALAKKARLKHPNKPLIALGHFLCQDSSTDPAALSSHRSIYFNQKFSTDLFCDSYDYVALGHNNNALSLDNGRIQYAGSPITTSEQECSARYVLMINLSSNNQFKIKRIDVPTFRSTIAFEGSCSELVELLEEQSEPQKAYLYATITQTISHSELLRKLESHAANVQLIELKHLQEQRYLNTDTPISMLNPEQIFSEIYAQKYSAAPSQALLDLIQKASEQALSQSQSSSSAQLED